MKKETIQEEAPPVDKPKTMEELLGQAHNDWKFKRRDEAFMKVLNALAMMSAGVAKAMKDSEEALANSNKSDLAKAIESAMPLIDDVGNPQTAREETK